MDTLSQPHSTKELKSAFGSLVGLSLSELECGLQCVPEKRPRLTEPQSFMKQTWLLILTVPLPGCVTSGNSSSSLGFPSSSIEDMIRFLPTRDFFPTRSLRQLGLVAHTQNLNLKRLRHERQEFQASLHYMRPCLKNKKEKPGQMA